MSTLFWNEPQITILASTSLDASPNPIFAQWTTNDSGEQAAVDILPEVGGRVCYDSFGKGRKSNKEYLGNIIDHGHLSVIEHSSVTFGLRGISRACSHEIVRHRHLSFSQRSQRYCTEISFVMHPALPPEQAVYFRAAMVRVKHDYEMLLGQGSKEAARMILPNATATEMVITGNMRAWREFVQKRAILAADPEIRQVAFRIGKALKELAPNTFQDMIFEPDNCIKFLPS